MPSISQCLPNKTVETEFGDVKVTTVVNSAFLTPEVEDLLNSEQDKSADTATSIECELYSRLFVEWDLTDNNDKPIGTDAQSLYTTPVAILRRVFTSVQENLRPNGESASGSGGG